MSTIKELRKNHNLSQQKVANELWITRQTFSKIEKGESKLSLWQAVKLTELFDVNIDVFLPDTDNSQNKEIKLEKYEQIVTNFIKYGSVNNKIPKTKLAKLCYLLDFSWYYNNLNSITNLEYKKLQYWPVPGEYFYVLDKLNGEQISINIKDKAHLIENKEAPSRDKLSEDEFNLLKKIWEKWKYKNTDEIVEFTHQQLPWAISDENEIISYDLITQEDPDNVY